MDQKKKKKNNLYTTTILRLMCVLQLSLATDPALSQIFRVKQIAWLFLTYKESRLITLQQPLLIYISPRLIKETDCEVRGRPMDSFPLPSKELAIIIQPMLALALVLYQIYEHSFGAMW